jgi:hypothetical protein
MGATPGEYYPPNTVVESPGGVPAKIDSIRRIIGGQTDFI